MLQLIRMSMPPGNRWSSLWRVFTLLIVIGLQACSLSPENRLHKLQLPAAIHQVLLVTSSDWGASTATVQRMARVNNHWQKVGASVPARVGRNGMGWGLGLHTAGPGVQKQEGDGKAPAGIFTLGTAFGYASSAPAGRQWPYRSAGERDYFVDDVASADYNRWCFIPQEQANEPARYWASFERMHRGDQQYEHGLLVNHNTSPTQPGRGSAIFLHVWLDPRTPTSGCTAMARDDLLAVLDWLEPSANPVLVQLPSSAWAGLQFQP